MRLQGKRVLVTGAGRGIGRAIAVSCASEGTAVALVGRSTDELHDVARQLRDAGSSAVVVTADVRDPESTRRMVAEAEAALGPIDVLVANSGVSGPTSPLWETSVEEWDDTFAVNVRGVFLSCRAVLPGMVARRSGAIVVIGSMTGKRPLLHRTPYASTKAALIGFVRSLAMDAGPYGIRVNLVSPGPVAGPRLDRVLEGQADATGRPVAVVREELLRISPLRRLADPQDVAAAVVFLSSDEAQSITGDDTNVSAGMTMH